jgi:hypothetical protein
MDKEPRIIDYLKDHMEDLISVRGLGIRFEAHPRDKGWHPDFVAHASYKKIRFKLIGEILSQKSSAILEAKLALLKSHASKDAVSVPLLVARYFSPAQRKRCQEEGVAFLDLSGNVSLEFDGLYVERIGFPSRFPEKRTGRGVFSDKATLILRAALSDARKSWGVRELAQSTGLDPGFVSRMVRELENKNYFSRSDSKLMLRDPKSLLEDWVKSYDYRRNQEARYFCLAKGPDEIVHRLNTASIPDDIRYALGFHAGANLLDPYAVYNEVHIYVQDAETINWFVDTMKLRESREGANLILLLPHYRHSVFYGRQEVRNLWVVSDLQLYLDLYNFPQRGLEQAEHIYERRLKRVVENG